MKSKPKQGLACQRNPRDHFLYTLIYYDYRPELALRLLVPLQARIRRGEPLASLTENGEPLTLESPMSGTVVQLLEPGPADQPGTRRLLVLQKCDHTPKPDSNVCSECGEQAWTYQENHEREFRRWDFKEVADYNADLTWNVVLNQTFAKGDRLGSIGDSELMLDFQGRVTFLESDPHCEIIFKARKTICKHQKIYDNICFFCSQLVRPAQSSIVGQSNGCRLRGGLLRKAEEETLQKLKEKRKIMLILDLDNTILHCLETTTAEQVPPLREYFCITAGDILLIVKMRAYLREFLAAVMPLYEVYIYTKGTRMYAESICDHIRSSYTELFADDSQSEAFTQNRIVSRDEDSNLEKKSLNNIISKSEGFIAIMDDRREVWGRPPNALQVKFFKYFYGKNEAGQLLYQKYDDPYLHFAADYMVALHKRFYEAYDQAKNSGSELPNFGKIVRAFRSEWLKGYKAIFMLEGQLQNNRIYRRALEMGIQPILLSDESNPEHHQSPNQPYTSNQNETQHKNTSSDSNSPNLKQTGQMPAQQNPTEKQLQNKKQQQGKPASESKQAQKQTQKQKQPEKQENKSEQDLKNPQAEQPKKSESQQGKPKMKNMKGAQKLGANLIICQQKGLTKDYKYYKNVLQIPMVSTLWIDYVYIYNYKFDPRDFEFKQGSDPYSQSLEERDLFDEALFRNCLQPEL